MRLLVVEDETAMANGLKFNFEQEGYDVVLAADGVTALELFQEPERPIDLVVLDLMLPRMSGYETCTAIREIDEQVPILVLSARTLSQDKAQAFDCGTDQYMTKPFALPELLSRVRNLLERRAARRDAANNGKTGEPKLYQFGKVTVDLGKFQLTVDGKTHDLTTMEFQLLRYFIRHEGTVLSRLQIMEDVWGETIDISNRTIDNFVMRLRRLVEDDPSTPRHIVSVRGTGYRFIAAPAVNGSS
jgi:two-component system OmpR family response regulator